jgi:2'-5' RNA ligase
MIPLAHERFRLFVAIAIPEPVRAELERAQIELGRASPDLDVRWTKPEQFHLTLKFLGNVEIVQIDSLTNALRHVCHGFAPLNLRVQDIGSFPDWHYPRVIWAGIRDAQETLLRLQSALEEATQPFTAEEREEKFSGHVTLGRIKRIARPQAETLARLAATISGRSLGEWRVAQVDLMQSQLGPKGAQHTALAGLPLEVR